MKVGYWLAAALLAAAAGCSRAHLHPNVGKAYKRVKTAQLASRPLPRGQKAVAGLEAEEANRVYNKYMEAFGPATTKGAGAITAGGQGPGGGGIAGAASQIGAMGGGGN